MKKLFVMFALMLFVGSVFSFTSCRNQRKDDNKVEKALDNAGDAIDTAAQDTKDAVQKESNKFENKTENN